VHTAWTDAQTGDMSEQHVREGRTPNRLIDETSPYLLQHAHNPVDWYPWGAEALERARREDKPILLSVGYAACHWCHVMERESFEDDETAALMNEHFVPVKVDREERPDLDGIYMDAVQAMTGQGGWPMTVFLTPDGAPFFAGTYFPPADRHGLPGFRRVLAAVAGAWRERRGDLLTQGRQVLDHIDRASRLAATDQPLTESLLRAAFDRLRAAHDPDWGGFGAAPKFPQPMTLEFLLRCHVRGWGGALDMVTRTCDRMLTGGIYDQVGGGFHRYATDQRWLVPHFEKMLYDNAQLVRLYTRLWLFTRAPRHRRVALETAEYLLRELRHPAGGFYSSADADSEGEEGRFFTWDYDELVELAGEPVAAWYGALPEGNWEGRNVLWAPRPPETVAAEAGIDVAELSRLVDDGRAALFERRERRVRPATDDKVLAAWNGLAISALAEAGRAFGEPRYVAAAVRAAEFVLTELRTPKGRLLRAWRDGRGSGSAYLDDYALLAEACLTLYETTYEPRWLETSLGLAGDILRLFADPDGDGFYQTGADAEALVVRPRELSDNATPAGNSAAAELFQRLAHLTGDANLEAAGISALRLVADVLPKAPTGFGHALGALDLYLSRVAEVAIVGDPADPATAALVGEVRSTWRPNVVLAVGRPDDGAATAAVPLLSDRPLVDGRPTAYVCEGFTCQLPVTDPEALGAQLDAFSRRRATP
jgi:uncharacterized protein YyaL (SSP411 family)